MSALNANDGLELDYEEECEGEIPAGALAQLKLEDEEKKQQKQHLTTLHSNGQHTHTATFKEFMLRPELFQALHEVGFSTPSVVQTECLNQANLGMDLLCQAKSGTGKTGVYIISTLQQLVQESVEEAAKPAILALAPTRELSFQIAHQFQRFKKHMAAVRLALFFGGLSFAADVQVLKKGLVHIVVGTPGRILALIKAKALDLSGVKHFIVDECDKMLAQLDMRADVQEIFTATPTKKQVMMFTATLPNDIKEVCRKFMDNPVEIVIKDESKLILERLKQYYVPVATKEKTEMLLEIHNIVEFDQMIIFVNTVQDCGVLGELLNEQGLQAIMIHSAMAQDERLARYNQFKLFKSRVLVATDLFGRGMDIAAVNIVVNYDCPRETSTYLHRISRAGRFDKKGLAITFVSGTPDKLLLEEFRERYDAIIEALPDELEFDTYNNHPRGAEPTIDED